MNLFLSLTGTLLLTLILVFLFSKILQFFFKQKNLNYFNDFKILGTQYIDNQNKVVKFHHNNFEYIILVGKNTNLLLDKRSTNENTLIK